MRVGLNKTLGSRTLMEWILMGLLLVLIQAGLSAISAEFEYGRDVLSRPVGWMIGLMCASGLVYLIGVQRLQSAFVADRRWWIWMIGVGIAMRLLMFPSTPMMDDDYYRYLWDGGVVAHGHSPYARTPEEVFSGAADAERSELAAASQGVIDRVNHPWLRTIYPPLAQAAFAAAHLLDPWGIIGLRVMWSLFDMITLALLATLIRAVHADPRQLVVYWWNPLLVKEIYNTVHMDILILPFVVVALLLAARGRHLVGAMALAIGAGVKLWPLVLVPAILRHKNVSGRRAAAALATSGVVGAVITAPLLWSLSQGSSGLYVYATRWEMNDALYTLLYAAAHRLMPEGAHAAARVAAALLLVGWTAWVLRKPGEHGQQICRRALWIVAALFLLSPTQFPWYWLWMLPLLTVAPAFGLLALTATLPLYYLRFPMELVGFASWFDYGVVWIQFSPAFAAIAWEARQTMRARARPTQGWVAAHDG